VKVGYKWFGNGSLFTFGQASHCPEWGRASTVVANGTRGGILTIQIQSTPTARDTTIADGITQIGRTRYDLVIAGIDGQIDTKFVEGY
jgi:hypothetical protein